MGFVGSNNVFATQDRLQIDLGLTVIKIRYIILTNISDIFHSYDK